MNVRKEKMKRMLLGSNEFYLTIFICILVTIFQIGNPNYLTAENIFDVLKSISYMGLFAMAMFIPIMSGGIDISICTIAGCSQYVMGIMMVKYSDLSPAIIILMGLITGLLMGMINGILIHLLEVPEMIVTISTMNLYYSALQLLTKGEWLYRFPEWFQKAGAWNVFTLQNKNGGRYGLSGLSLIWFISMLVVYFIMNRCSIGRKVYAMGGDMISAKRAGINAFKMRLFIYSMSGILSALAGMIQAASAQFITTTSVYGLEMHAIAAIALGGASLDGGKGHIFGTILGIIIIEMISNGLQLMRVSSYWSTGVIGVIVLISVIVTACKSIYQRRRVET